jgi:putative transposase
MDNGSSHKALAVQACSPEWERKGLICFFLPPYCSEMNLIEGEWRQLNAYEISERMFEAEGQRSLAIIEGIEHRYKAAGFTPQRFEFIYA